MSTPNRPLRIAAAVSQISGFAQTLLSGCARWLSEHPRSGVWVTKLEITSTRIDLSPFDGVLYHSGIETFERRIQRFARPAINTSANSPRVPVNSVLSDDLAAARLALEHLLERGRSDLAVLWVDGPLYHRRRHTQFEQALNEKGLKALHVALPVSQTRRDWQKAIRRIADAAGALGIFATDNQIGVRLCHELTEAGVAVPEDVAVVGIGNETNLCEFCTPPLSSVDTGIDGRGYRALGELVAQINGKPALTEPILVQPRGVIIRQSSDLAAVRDPEVRLALRYIHDRADESIEIDALVRHVNISRRALEQRFRQSLHRTIHEEIWRAHLQLARHLLISSDLPMYHVAARSGYGTVSNFSTLFRRAVGIPPAEFRRHHRSGG